MLLDFARQKATPVFRRSACPCCRMELIAKCGSLKRWHWAHVSKIDCDYWSEGLSAWHLAWQDRVKESCQEVVIRGEHRADICLSTGQVIELQHSPISPEDIEERERFYGNMLWIFDAEPFKHNLFLREKLSKHNNLYYTFRWKRPRHSILSCQKFPIYFDMGMLEEFADTPQILEVKKFNSSEYDGNWGSHTVWYGWGYLLERNEHFYRYLFANDYQPPLPYSVPAVA